MAAVVDYSSGGIVQQSVEFSYDAIGRRISKTVDGALTYFVYDGIDVLFDFVDADGEGGNSPILSQRYLHGPAIDQVLVQEAGTGEALWLLADHLGTTRDLVDNAGLIANHLKYDSFGNVVEESNGTISTSYLYTGRVFQAELGLYYYRTRFYDATTGIFLSEDTLGLGSGTNVSRYVENSPVRYSDPFGQEPVMAQVSAAFGDAPSPADVPFRSARIDAELSGANAHTIGDSLIVFPTNNSHLVSHESAHSLQNVVQTNDKNREQSANCPVLEPQDFLMELQMKLQMQKEVVNLMSQQSQIRQTTSRKIVSVSR